MRLACDEMLLRLGKWLRAAGYDTAIADRGARDEHVVAMAVREQRVLLTCDKRMVPLLERVDVAYLMLPTSRARDAVSIVTEVLGVDFGFAKSEVTPERWSRCLKCNVLLEDLPREELPPLWLGRVPPCKDLYRCPACRHVYWEGSHVRRLDARMAELKTV
jgi:uncharacterized protein with PIN domain